MDTKTAFYIFNNLLNLTQIFESFAALTGLLAVYLGTTLNKYVWPTTIVSTITAAVVYQQSDLYGQFTLQFVFLVIGIYGYYNWHQNNRSSTDVVKTKVPSPTANIEIKKLSYKLSLVCLVVILTLTLAITYLLGQTGQNSETIIPDAFITATAIMAQLLLALRYIDNWYLWLIVNLLSVALLVYISSYILAALYFAYLIIGINGLIQWRKAYNKQCLQNPIA